MPSQRGAKWLRHIGLRRLFERLDLRAAPRATHAWLRPQISDLSMPLSPQSLRCYVSEHAIHRIPQLPRLVRLLFTRIYQIASPPPPRSKAPRYFIRKNLSVLTCRRALSMQFVNLEDTMHRCSWRGRRNPLGNIRWLSKSNESTAQAQAQMQ